MTTHLLAASGGKDSTAAGLHLVEQGIPFTAHFYDTGWESPETYAYLDTLEAHLGPITVHVAPMPDLGADRLAMALEVEALIGRSPSGFVRWALHGIRAAESRERAELAERELDAGLDCVVWRPLLTWSLADVVAIHRRHGVTPNPLYLRGARRVGCWPCVASGRAELMVLDDARIAAVELLERYVGTLAVEQHGEHSDAPPALLQAATRNANGKRPCTPIRQMVEWAQAGAPQAELLPGMSAGCLTWGLCDTGEAP